MEGSTHSAPFIFPVCLEVYRPMVDTYVVDLIIPGVMAPPSIGNGGQPHTHHPARRKHCELKSVLGPWCATDIRGCGIFTLVNITHASFTCGL